MKKEHEAILKLAECIDFGEVDTRHAQYNLTNDRLDSQPEEVIDFLYEIICE